MKLFQKKANLPFYILAFFIYLIPTVMVLGFFALPTVSIVENVKNQKNGVAFIEMQDAADEYGWNVVGWYIDKYGGKDYLEKLENDYISRNLSYYDETSQKLFFEELDEATQENTTENTNPNNQEYIEKPFWVNTEATPLNIREEPNQDSTIIGSIPRGENITVYTITDNWGFVNYESVGGWVNLLYCEHGYAPADLQNTSNPTVWYAESTTAKSYHLDPNCRFLNQTTHEIKHASLDYARNHGHPDPCDHCVLGK